LKGGRRREKREARRGNRIIGGLKAGAEKAGKHKITKPTHVTLPIRLNGKPLKTRAECREKVRKGRREKGRTTI